MLLGVLTAVVLAVYSHGAAGTELLARDVPLRGNPKPSSGRSCRNTFQGRLLITDDQGYICTREQLDFSSSCCKIGEKYSCNTCNLADKCCEELEYCVSCCLKPEHKPDVMYKKMFRARRRPDIGNFTDEFDYCLGTCRTHARSTSHENDYIGPRHHCFSVLGRPMLSGPVPPGALDGVTVVVSNAGQSCDKACSEQHGSRCSAALLPVLNSCDRLREHVGCEAGCEFDEFHPYLPGYVSSAAPKQEHPALCIIAKKVEAGSCTEAKKNIQRLCPCVSGSQGGRKSIDA